MERGGVERGDVSSGSFTTHSRQESHTTCSGLPKTLCSFLKSIIVLR